MDKIKFCYLVMEVHKQEGIVMRVAICESYDSYMQIPTAHKLIVHTTDGINYKSAEDKMLIDLRLPKFIWLLAFMYDPLVSKIHNAWSKKHEKNG